MIANIGITSAFAEEYDENSSVYVGEIEAGDIIADGAALVKSFFQVFIKPATAFLRKKYIRLTNPDLHCILVYILPRRGGSP
jgi:hypothetical protein